MNRKQLSQAIYLILAGVLLAGCGNATTTTPTALTAAPTTSPTPSPSLTPTTAPTTMSTAAPSPASPIAPDAMTTSEPPIPLPVRDELTFTLKGQLGGTFNPIALDGDIVYVGVGPRLTTVDISDPTKPTFLWQSEVLPGKVEAVAVQSGLVYLRAGNELQIYDATDPTKLVLLSGFEGVSGDLYPAGDHVYTSAAGVSGGAIQPLIAIDVNDPTLPVAAGEHMLSGPAEIAASGNVLYIATGGGAFDNSGEGKLQLVDPINLEQTFSEIALGGAWSYKVAASGDVAYVLENRLSGEGDKLLVLDVSDPAKPREVATYQLAIDPTISWITATDKALFLLGESWPEGRCPTRLYVFELRDHGSPDRPAEFDPQSCFNSLALAGDTLVATSDRGLQIFDVSNPGDIALAGELGPPAGLLDVQRIALNQGLAYSFSTAGGPRLRVLDISQPTPTPLTGEALDLSSQYDFGLGGLYVRGKRLFLQIQYYLIAMDISQPAIPRLIKPGDEGVNYDPPPPVVIGDLFFTPSADGLAILDMRDPENPVLANTISTEGFTVMGLSVTDRHLIVFSQKPYGETRDGTVYITRLQIYDISDPLTPVEVGRLEPAVDLPEMVWVLTTAGDTVYAASILAGELNRYTLYALDISDPSQPVEIGRFALQSDVLKMVPAGDTIYLFSDGIWALDVRDRSHPYLAGRVPFPAGDFSVDGDLLYLAAGDDGLYIVQVEK